MTLDSMTKPLIFVKALPGFQGVGNWFAFSELKLSTPTRRPSADNPRLYDQPLVFPKNIITLERSMSHFYIDGYNIIALRGLMARLLPV
jgi:hypothetical protein